MEFEDQEPGSEPGYSDSNTNRPPPTMPSPPSPPPPPPRRPRYKECLKNHAVGIGGNAVDGCGEFLPAGEDGSLESLRCAACSCHRNFHRRETEPGGAGAAPPFGGAHYPPPPPQQLLLAHHGHFGYVHAPQPRRAAGPLALPSCSGGGGGGGSGSREETDDYYSGGGGGSKNKRFRTKFTAEQKEKMLNFAEGLDWKIQKHDEETVQKFCSEVGVKRKVLKVWMHNNKKM